ncbi:MAG: heterodisulfide reductase-related iron-sulfur binding cluster [Aeromicrobium erythreum]
MQIVAIIVSLGFTAVAVPLTVIAVRHMLRTIRAGQPAVNRTGNPVGRTVTMVKETFLHTRMLQWTWVGILHWFAYAAFLFLSTAVAQAYFQLFDAHFAWPIIGKWFLYEWAGEALGLLGSLAIIPLFVYRVMNRPSAKGRQSRFFGSTMWQAYFVEFMVLLESSAILFIRGAEYNLMKAEGDDHASAFHFPISQFFGNLYPTGEQSIGTLENIIFFIAMIKITSAMIWLIVIARNLTMGVAWHRFTAWFNIWFKREEDGGTALGGLKPLYIDGKPLTLESMEELEEEDFEKLGVGKVEDFSWKGILDFTTCTECGRCQSQCPAWNTEKPLSPKLLMLGLREHAYAKLPLLDQDADTLTEEQTKELERPLIGDAEMYGVIDPDVLWSCTNCGACVQQCPVDIEHVDHIDDMRRFQVLVESNFPAELNNIFKGLERKGNPWGMNPKNRLDWTKGLDFEVKQVGVDVESLDEVEWLFWVGCAGAFEDRAKKTTQAVAELLHTAGVDFAILGDGETCTGDPARRAGNEIVFMQLAMENSEVLKETKAKKVVSTCAHCFNSLKNEYAEFGLELEVVHHTQLLNRLVREGRLKPVAPAAAKPEKTITYHDPCFLGRHNQVYEAPRELLNVIPGAKFAEMPRNSERSFCCGAGGARMWMEENLGSRININRTQEAVATGADQIAVGCPFCRVMMSDGLTAQQQAGEAREEVEVLDVAQMLLAAVKREPSAEDEGDVVAEAEAATAAAASETTDATEKATEAEPDAEDRADDTSISETAEAAPAADATESGESTTEQDVDELDEPQGTSTQEDVDVAAKHDVEVDEQGGGHADEDGAGKDAEGEQPQAEAEQPSSEDTSSDEPEPEPHPEPGDTTDPETEAVPADEPATSEPDEEEADPREEEAETLEATDVVAVEDAPAPDPVSDDAAPLSDANPSGQDVSEAATQAGSDEADEAKDDDAKA